MDVTTSSEILIVGAGCFGLSTAYHLLKRGFRRVTIVDRSSVIPAPDAASTDINKIVRSSYSDIYYARLAREAIAAWKDEKEWGDTYHESGVFCPLLGNDSYTDQAYVNDIALGARIENLENASAVRSVFPPGVKIGLPEEVTGYLNRDGGWAFAEEGVSRLMSKVLALGGQIIAGKQVVELLRANGSTTGVRCSDGTVFDADLIVLSAGSWTASSFPSLDLGQKCLATGQCVGLMQLTPEEGERYRKCPVYLDFNSGFYMFPPNADNVVKMAIHASGYTQMLPADGSTSPISTPRTIQSHGEQGLRIPRSALKELRQELAKVYPELAAKPFSWTRLCWYTDSPDDDWVIGPHPSDPKIMLATAGSGHAYKFLPVIGRVVADSIQGVLHPALIRKFAVDRQQNSHTVSRVGNQPRELELDQLCTPEDLLA
ncbi:L-pipecolate oxidase [Grifola frondosa]|uniref:L-pipecolate oxidase n=1 Tax=Grifola frondosa TaxID=5627 RepID=A0A1C7LYC2_GRIFR|nr:L-pipecolate oxidase [Grifola frondosa]